MSTFIILSVLGGVLIVLGGALIEGLCLSAHRGDEMMNRVTRPDSSHRLDATDATPRD